eukprot:4322435-Pyramimonas_sp.AAC.1
MWADQNSTSLPPSGEMSLVRPLVPVCSSSSARRPNANTHTRRGNMNHHARIRYPQWEYK